MDFVLKGTAEAIAKMASAGPAPLRLSPIKIPGFDDVGLGYIVETRPHTLELRDHVREETKPRLLDVIRLWGPLPGGPRSLRA